MTEFIPRHIASQLIEPWPTDVRCPRCEAPPGKRCTLPKRNDNISVPPHLARVDHSKKVSRISGGEYILELESKLAVHEKDIEDAATIFAVALPAPGSDVAKVMRRNSHLSRENGNLHAQLEMASKPNRG